MASSTPSNSPWLRVKAGAVVGQYSYLQVPDTSIEDNPLYSGSVKLPNAPTTGGELTANAWLPDTPFLGMSVRVSMLSYVAEWPSAVEGGAATAINDFVPVVQGAMAGRYAFSEGDVNLYAAGKVGYQYSDFMRYTWAGQAGTQTTVQYKALAAQGLTLGAEIGGDAMGGDLFFSAGFTEGFIGAAPYSSTVDLEAGYAFLPNVFGSLGFNLFTRSITLSDSASGFELGELSDNGWSLTASAGYQY
jgi:hypothetical protein